MNKVILIAEKIGKKIYSAYRAQFRCPHGQHRDAKEKGLYTEDIVRCKDCGRHYIDNSDLNRLLRQATRKPVFQSTPPRAFHRVDINK